MNSGIESHYFTEDAVRTWTAIGARHRLRDEQFLRVLDRYFCPGPVLELGAGTGHLSEILQHRGWDVTASDVSLAFVAAIRSRGLRGAVVDATGDIRSQTGKAFANILAQNVLPLIFRDRTTLCAALNAIHSALQEEGRLICITAHARCDPHPERYYSPREQIEIVEATGLFRIVKSFPHQVMPPALYREWNARFLNILDFQLARLAAVRLVWIAEKTG